VADDGVLKYAIYDPRGDTQSEGEYLLLWRDAIGELHDTFKRIGLQAHETTQPIVWWRHSKWDRRACGPEGEVFPRPEGWLLDGIKVNLDELSIQKYTKALTMRKFRTPHARARGNRD
jgi:hypothetical protein